MCTTLIIRNKTTKYDLEARRFSYLKKFKVIASTGKVMATVLGYPRSENDALSGKKGSTVTGAYYANEIVYTPATRGIEHKAKSCDMWCMWYC